MFKILLPLLTVSLIASETPQNIIDIGNKVSMDLQKKLGSKLKHELQTNGVLSAAKFCNENAYTLTQDVNLHQLEGISVKRISLKERNPANIPSTEETQVLQEMQKLHNSKSLPPFIVTQEKEGVYKYYKPLVIKKQVCLACHGDISTSPKLSNFIQENYPLDKATMYKMNDLRGAIVVEINQ